MHLGVPVACSRVGSLPEVGGSAVLYFDPNSPQGIAGAILRITEDEGLRHQLVAAGKERVKLFNYSETARQTLAVFEKIRGGLLVCPDLPPFRPLIAHNWLNEGHSRWYFRCVSLREVELEVVQPTALRELADQAIRVSLDGQEVLESPIQPQRRYQFAIPARDHIGSGLHRLDISASAAAWVEGQSLSVQVPSIVITNSDGNRLRLIR